MISRQSVLFFASVSLIISYMIMLYTIYNSDAQKYESDLYDKDNESVYEKVDKTVANIAIHQKAPLEHTIKAVSENSNKVLNVVDKTGRSAFRIDKPSIGARNNYYKVRVPKNPSYTASTSAVIAGKVVNKAAKTIEKVSGPLQLAAVVMDGGRVFYAISDDLLHLNWNFDQTKQVLMEITFIRGGAYLGASAGSKAGVIIGAYFGRYGIVVGCPLGGIVGGIVGVYTGCELGEYIADELNGK